MLPNLRYSLVGDQYYYFIDTTTWTRVFCLCLYKEFTQVSRILKRNFCLMSLHLVILRTKWVGQLNIDNDVQCYCLSAKR